MPFFPRFGKRWAATAAIAEPTDNQADAGFGHLGPNPPTVEGFNAIFQWLDDKDGWLYGQIAAVLTKAGITPTANTLTDLRQALVTMADGQSVSVLTSGSVTVPAWATRAHLRMRGGSGGATGANSAGSGGGGGEYREGVVAITPGASIFVTVGAAGSGGVGSNGGAGGATSFGSLMSAAPGAGGGWGNNGIVTTAGTGGALGSGAGYSAFGNDGGLGVLIGFMMAQGVGGASYGAGGNPLVVAGSAATGIAGAFRGVGGNGGVNGGAGGAGRTGEVFIRWLP